MQWRKPQNSHQDYWQRALVCFHTLGYLYRPGETRQLRPVYMAVVCPSARSDVQGLESFPGMRPLFPGSSIPGCMTSPNQGSLHLLSACKVK